LAPSDNWWLPKAGRAVSHFRGNPQFFEDQIPRVIHRLCLNVDELDRKVKRAGGLLFGTMTAEEAFERLQEAERLIAEVRALASR
jgi:hypothetical protein